MHACNTLHLEAHSHVNPPIRFAHDRSVRWKAYKWEEKKKIVRNYKTIKWIWSGADGDQTILVLESGTKRNQYNKWTAAFQLIAGITVDRRICNK